MCKTMQTTPMLVLLLITICVASDSNDWDVLVYSQRWPITACAEWEEKSEHNTCNMPPDKSMWTVHGVWPDKNDKEGPFFCNSSLHFDLSQLDPIMDAMKTRWINVEANTKLDSFWVHEWKKHGTCASSLPQLNSVFNYFNQGLKWNQEYDLALLLANNGIVPSEKAYSAQDISEVIAHSLGKNPQIFCQVDRKTKESMLSEIRICFDKSLSLIDCAVKPVHLGSEVITNCDKNKPVKYYADLPMTYDDYSFLDSYETQKEIERRKLSQQLYEHLKFRYTLESFLKLIDWISWATITY